MDYKTLTDEKLCILAQNNDKNASNELAERYKYAVNSVARSYYLVGGDFNDLLQEGNMGLVNAIKNFDNNGLFKSFAFKCIKNSIFSAIRKSNANKNIPLNNYISLSGDNENDTEKSDLLFDVSSEDPLQSIINNETFKELTDFISNSLSSYEKKILQLYLKGYSYDLICTSINKDNKSVDNALQRIRKKIANIKIK